MPTHLDRLPHTQRQRPATNDRRIRDTEARRTVFKRIKSQTILSGEFFPGLDYFGLFGPFHETEGGAGYALGAVAVNCQ